MSKFILTGFSDEIAKDFKTQLEVMGRLGIKFIEIRGVNGKNITDHSLDEVIEIKTELDKAGIGVSAVGSPIGKIKITDDFEPHLEKFKHTLDIADILKTKYIRLFSFFMPNAEACADYRDEVLKRMQAFVDVAEGRGITLLHENESDIYGDTAERALDIVKSINSPILKNIIDPSNYIICNEEVFPKAYEMLCDYTVYMHIKDCVKETKKIVPSGQGDGKIYELLKALWEKGYEGFLSIEPHLGKFDGLSAQSVDDKWKDLPDSGPLQFVIATEALTKIIDKIVK